MSVPANSTVLALPGEISAVGLRLPPDISFDQWNAVGDQLKAADRSVRWWVGDWLVHGERKWGEMYAQAMDATEDAYQTLADAKWVSQQIDFSRRREKLSHSHHKEVAALAPAEQSEWLEKAETEGWSRNELRRAIGLWKANGDIGDPIELVGRYACIVIDPPWVMEKIEREVRPKQSGFDYPTMTEEELADSTHVKWRGASPPDIASDNCHLYLWTTHKHLPSAMRLAAVWGFRYECMMTWVKNVGFTPYSWMRSTEHVLFCRRGSLQLSKLGLRLDFAGKVRQHSRKPDEFYDLVRIASPGPRIDVFSREPRDGFDQWGNQINAFAETANG